jgi:hypothetical protein
MEKSVALELFGKKFIESCRDRSIVQLKQSLVQTRNPVIRDYVNEMLPGISDAQKEVIQNFVPYCVDTVLAMVLGMLEENEDIELSIISGESRLNIRDISDGLNGELHSDEGWIRKYSSF